MYETSLVLFGTEESPLTYEQNPETPSVQDKGLRRTNGTVKRPRYRTRGSGERTAPQNALGTGQGAPAHERQNRHQKYEEPQSVQRIAFWGTDRDK